MFISTKISELLHS